jgi:hypothetical protein
VAIMMARPGSETVTLNLLGEKRRGLSSAAAVSQVGLRPSMRTSARPAALGHMRRPGGGWSRKPGLQAGRPRQGTGGRLDQVRPGR